MKRLIAMAAAVGTALSLYGCSSGESGASQTSSEADVPKLPSVSMSAEDIEAVGSPKTYSFKDYTASLSAEFIPSGSEDNTYIFTMQHDPLMAVFMDFTGTNLTAAAHAEGFAQSYVENGFEADWEEYPNPWHDCAVFHIKSDGSEEAAEELKAFKDYACIDMYVVADEQSLLLAGIGYAEGYEDITKGYVDYILSALDYTGGKHQPDEPQTSENDFVSVNYQPKWEDITRPADNGTAAASEIMRFRYYRADSEVVYLTQYAVEAIFVPELGSAEDYAENIYSRRFDDSKITSGYKLEESEILGCPSYKVSYKLDSGKTQMQYLRIWHYFEKYGIVYCISYTAPLNDDGTAQADIDELIASTVIKEPDPDVLSGMTDSYNASLYTELTLEDAAFTVSGGFSEYSSGSGYIELRSDAPAELKIECYENIFGSADDYYYTTRSDLMEQAGNSYFHAGTYYTDNYKFASFEYIDPYEYPYDYRKLYCTVVNGKVWEFTIRLRSEDGIDREVSAAVEDMLDTFTVQ